MQTLSLKIEQYEGPLDLLLALISKHKLNIFDIPISEIAEQYMEYINSMKELNMEVTSDFIEMAAELMLIKSKMLLPKQEGEEDPRQPLVDALLEHQRAIQAAAFLKQQSELYYDRFTKEPDQTDGIYFRLHAVSLLQEAFLSITERSVAKPLKIDEKLFTKIENERYYTIDEKVISVLRKLAKRERYLFEEIFDGVRSRGELVAVFLAVLETVSKGRVGVIREEDKLYLTLIRNKHTETIDD
jgi:segregation and condensation protein A